MKKRVAFAMTAAGLAAATAAHAQSSVTLYGIVDNAIAWQNNSSGTGATSGGHSKVQMATGIWAGSRFGLKGSEDLGGGTKAIFQLEAGFNANNGSSQWANGIFTRQAWVGLTNQTYGTLTAGRQYTAYYTLLSPYSPTTWLTGYYGAHPGDIDSLDTSYRANNSLVYMSPKFYGFTVGGSYSLGGVAGSFNRGSTWSAAIQYLNGPAGIAVGFQKVNNSTLGGGVWGDNSTVTSGGQPAVSSINSGYQTAQTQQRLGVTAGYQFTPAWDVSVSYTNVQYVPGVVRRSATRRSSTRQAPCCIGRQRRSGTSRQATRTRRQRSRTASRARPSTTRSRCRSTTVCRSARACTQSRLTSTQAATR